MDEIQFWIKVQGLKTYLTLNFKYIIKASKNFGQNSSLLENDC